MDPSFDCITAPFVFPGSKRPWHGNKFERISSNFDFEWTKFEFSKNRNKFELLCSNFELSIKRASVISTFHLVFRGLLGRLYSHHAKRVRTGAKT